MKRTLPFWGLLVAAAFVLASCSNFFGSASKAGTGGAVGAVSVTVPSTSAFVQKLTKFVPKAGASRGLAPKALLVADKVTFTITGVTDASFTPVTWTVNGVGFNSATATAALSAVPPAAAQNLPVGNYDLTVDVYNAANSTSVAVVSGTEPLAITAGGTTPVTVTCFPNNPAAATHDGSPNAVASMTPWILGATTATTTTGAEAWFSFTAPGAYSSVTVSQAASSVSVPAFAVFDQSGALVDYDLNAVKASSATLGFNSPDSAYYVAVIDIGPASGTRGMTLSVVSATAPAPSKADRLKAFSLWIGSTEYPAFIDQYGEYITVPPLPPGTVINGNLKETFTASAGAVVSSWDLTTGVQANDATLGLTDSSGTPLADSVFASNGHADLYVYDSTGADYTHYWIYIPMADQDYVSAFSLANGGGTGVTLNGTILENSHSNSSTIALGPVDASVDLATVAPAIVVSAGATVSPDTGVAADFSSGSVTYTVTNGAETRSYKVLVYKDSLDLIKTLSVVVNGTAYVGQVDQADEVVYLAPVPQAQADLTAVAPSFTTSAGATVYTDSAGTSVATSGTTTLDFSAGYAYLYVKATGSSNAYDKAYTLYLPGDL